VSVQISKGYGVYIKDFEGTVRVCVVYSHGFFTDFPIQYGNGKIVYDTYGVHSVTTRTLVRRAFRHLNKLEARKVYDKNVLKSFKDKRLVSSILKETTCK